MNFPNYTYPFFSLPFMYDALYGYPYMNGVGQEVPQPSQGQAAAESQPQVKVEHVLKKLNKQVLIENLKKFHEDQVRHRKTHWTEQEDKLLQKLVQIQKLQWRQIPAFFKERTQNMCYSRYRRISMGTKDRNWTKDQEQNVIELINRYGERWKFLSSKIPKFTPKQIRERYLNYLRPNISKDDFSLEEDQRICQYVIKHGKHWRRMEEIVEGRSEGAIKGRYYGKLHKIIESSFQEENF